MFLRYLALFLAGACLAAFVNLGTYRLAYFRRRISPWCRTRDFPLKRTWFDCLPILGWWALRREEGIHGRGFWIRPMLLEFAFGLAIAALYWWETERFAMNIWLERPNVRPAMPAAMAALHWQFAVHVVLLVLMALATLIDIDEFTIPDAITVPGTIVALLIAGLCRSPSLPVLVVDPNNPRIEDLITPLPFDYPNSATTFLSGSGSLFFALICFLFWCFALLPRRWRLGVNVVKACRVMYRRIVARPEWHWVLPIAIFGCIGIVAAWIRGGDTWRQLISALLGLAVGGGIVWVIRLIGGAVLKREAMGFGDVTLMAMIGAFIGWQAVLIVFFISPLVALIVAITQRLMYGENIIPYGPFLCLATVTVMVFWAPIWNKAAPYFEIPWLVPSAIAICLPVPFVLLFFWKLRYSTTNPTC